MRSVTPLDELNEVFYLCGFVCLCEFVTDVYYWNFIGHSLAIYLGGKLFSNT